MRVTINDISIVPTPTGVSFAPENIICDLEVCVSVNEDESVMVINVYRHTGSDQPVATQILGIPTASE